MAVTPAEKVRRFVDVGIGGDGSAGDKEEGRVRTSQDFRDRSSPPVGFGSESSTSGVFRGKVKGAGMTEWDIPVYTVFRSQYSHAAIQGSYSCACHRAANT